MGWFEYGDKNIRSSELMVAVPSMVIGVGVLTLPKELSDTTIGSDGWIPIVSGGILAIFFVWMITSLAARFPHQNFLTYASFLVPRPVAVLMTFTFGVIALLVTAQVVRAISDISKQYLFNRTPTEAIALAFLLVVVYAVSGSRTGLFRLNMMFLPIILFIIIVVLFFNLRWMEAGNVLPVFQTSLSSYIEGIDVSATSYMGISIFLFYTSLVENPKKAPRMAIIGMMSVVILYLLIFLTCIAVFGQAATSNMVYPTIELAKRVDFPGGILERFEAIFFVIWMMAIFNTTAMALDISVFAMGSIFKRVSKIKLLFILSPLVYFISMFPQNFREVTILETMYKYFTITFTISVTVILYVIAKTRKVRGGA